MLACNMSVLKEYEQEVLNLLAPSALSPKQIEAVVHEGKFVSYDYSGCGYFLTLSHPNLPMERKVCDKPIVIGHAEGVDCGFIIFIQDGELTIECHSWGKIDVPDGFREMNVRVDIPDDDARNGDT